MTQDQTPGKDEKIQPDDASGLPTPPTEHQPTYSTPTYETPSYTPPAYEPPSYQVPSYQAPDAAQQPAAEPELQTEVDERTIRQPGRPPVEPPSYGQPLTPQAPASTSYEPPAYGGYQPPAQGGYQPPAAQGGYEAPAANAGYQPPAASPYQAPAGNAGYQPPAAEGYAAPGAAPYGQQPTGAPYGQPGAPYGAPGQTPYGAPAPYGAPGQPMQQNPYGGVPAVGGTATALDRFLGALIDFILLGIVGGILYGIFGDNSAITNLLQFLIVVGYWTFMNGNGQTVGKMVMKTKVVDIQTGGSIGYTKGLIRGLVGYLQSLVFGLGWLSVPLDPEKRGFHDKAAGSRVIKIG